MAFEPQIKVSTGVQEQNINESAQKQPVTDHDKASSIFVA
jgi:hypothetical protein